MAIPAPVAALAAGAEVEVVWVNEVGGITFRLRHGRKHSFVKWSPAECEIDLLEERARLRWAGRFIVVPRVLDAGSDQKGSWLQTSAIAGENAIAARWRADPRTAVRVIGRGLRVMHDRLPVAECPFSWAADERVRVARARAGQGLIDPERWHSDHRDLTVDAALELVAEPPPIDRLIVCHGDACAPNTLLSATGALAGHVDLGSLGVGDRWADLAVATWSTSWNYGPGWEEELLSAYGVGADPARTAYYRLLWDLGP